MIFNALLSFTLLPLAAFAAPTSTTRAPIKRSISLGARSVAPSAYIVAIKADTVDPANRGAWLNKIMSQAGVSMSDAETSSLRLGWNETVMNGIAGTFSDSTLDVIRAQSEVAYVEPDYEMRISETVQQDNAPWGVSRLSTGPVSLQGLDPLALQFPYFSDSTGGAGTDVYVLDTGIRTTHSEFGGRATFLQTFGPGVPGQDINGHGTHVSGTVAGKTVGVAKQASVFMIKCVADDGSAATSDIISAINLAVQRSSANPNRPAVVNMSLGGPVSAALDRAVANAVASGLPFCVAAGNETQDANNSSPARLTQVITVGATDINDRIASFSNFGNKVDVFAPGDTIVSASFQGDDLGAVLSGTSMASPHIAGLAALMMGQAGKMTPAQLSTAITSVAQTGLISGIPRGTTNTLAFNNAVPIAQLQQSLANLGQAGAAANAATTAVGAVTTGTRQGGRNRNN
ncbi:probable endopeptidase K [Serendipita indica DSM 11827]|uniref:Probable endopeptidase K n=1 Tax=Serendipita indica (strain DSM 11827) TaxID=1109443 RepID=G4TFI5_SERID|nr:probable endopeptidase K [Serendipita indica DSM 11827]